MADLVQASLFDYASLDTETRVVVQQRTIEIKSLMKRAAQDIIEIGQKLIEVKAKLGHGNFGEWLKAEFDWHWNTANNFMRVADKFTNFVNLEGLAPSALYLLSAPSTPESARTEALERADQGEVITYNSAKEIVNWHRGQNTDLGLPSTWGTVEQADQVSDLFTPLMPTEWPPKPLSQELRTTLIPEPDEEDIHLPPSADQDAPARSFTIPKGVPPALQMSESNEWYTPAPYVNAARELMGGIDLDPASNAIANNRVVKATHYYTIQTNGLDKPWIGKVWLNPPYGRDNGESNQEVWSRRLIEQYEAGITEEAVLLVNAVTDRKWFQPLWDYTICFTDHRIRFYSPDTEAGQPTHGNVLVYFGAKVERFVELFSQFGVVVKRLSASDFTDTI